MYLTQALSPSSFDLICLCTDSWAAPPASAGLKTLLPVPTFEGESWSVIFMFVSGLSDGTQRGVGGEGGEDGVFLCFLSPLTHSINTH